MSGVVYPITGGMEDWAYSGSWEGSPIITQSCQPKTYGGYKENATQYEQNYKDSLKSIMFLLEVSNDKMPDQKLLGWKNLDCLINLRHNAFFNHITQHKHLCLDKYIDGYIPRILRLGLTLIDILNPYITFITQNHRSHIDVHWTVGGAVTVDETFMLYDYFPTHPDQHIIAALKEAKEPSEVEKILKNKTDTNCGKAVWDIEYNTKDHFKHKIETEFNNGNYIVFVIFAKVDKDWSIQNHPDPVINPQTHIANLRNSNNYKASNGEFELIGQEYFKSSVKIINIDEMIS